MIPNIKYYEETLQKLIIEFDNTSLLEFKYRDELRKEIIKFENLIEKINLLKNK